MTDEREKVQGHLSIEWDCPHCGMVNTLEGLAARTVACDDCGNESDVRPEHEQLQARVRPLEAALRDVRPEIESLVAGLQRSHEDPRTGIVHDEDVAHELSQLQALSERIDTLLPATAPPESEPAEGEGGDPDHSRDFEGIDPRGMGPLPGEPGNPNPSFEQMQNDAPPQLQGALEALERIYTRPCNYEGSIRDLDTVRRALSAGVPKAGVPRHAVIGALRALRQKDLQVAIPLLERALESALS